MPAESRCGGKPHGPGSLIRPAVWRRAFAPAGRRTRNELPAGKMRMVRGVWGVRRVGGMGSVRGG